MKKVKGMPITGQTPEYSTKKNWILPNAKDTSADAQKLISAAPTPFKDKSEVPNIPTGAGGAFGSNLPDAKPRPGLQRSSAPQNAPGSPVGQTTMPNQSGQIGGRNGFPPPKRKAGAYPSGYKSKLNAAFFGE